MILRSDELKEMKKLENEIGDEKDGVKDECAYRGGKPN